MATFEDIAQEQGATISTVGEQGQEILPVDNGLPESTMSNYFDVVSPFGVIYQNPELRYRSTMNQGGVDINNPEFTKLFEEADGEGKVALSEATSMEHAYAIAGRRREFQESSEIIAQDPLLVQIGMGLVPALASPTTVLPLGAIGNTAKIGMMVNKLGKVGAGVAVGAATGATANVIDESLFEAQGMQYNYLTAAAIGMGFGGLLGGVSGALSGPYAKNHAKNLSAEGDTFTKDFANDPSIEVRFDENGIIQVVGTEDVGQQSKFGLDYIPYFGKYFRSDVHTVYQGENSAMRSEMTKWANATVSRKDSKGNVVANTWNAQNEKAVVQGYHNTARMNVKDIYSTAKRSGEYKGSYDDFIADVSREYTLAGSKQENDVLTKLYPMAEGLKVQGGYKAQKALGDYQQPVPFTRDETGKFNDLTEAQAIQLEENRAILTQYEADTAPIREQNTQVDNAINTYMDQARAEGKFAANNKPDTARLEAEYRQSLEDTIGQSRQAIPEVDLPHAIRDTDVQLRERSKAEMAEFKEELKATTKAEYDAQYKEMRDKLYAEHPPMFKGSQAIQKAATEFQGYHGKVRKAGINSNLKELVNTAEGKLYRARAWNFEGIKNGDIDEATAKASLHKALASHPNQANYTAEQLTTSVDVIYEKLQVGAFDLKSLTTTYAMPNNLPFEGMLQSRQWKLDESQLGDLIKDNLEDVTGAYSYKMSGRVAVGKVTDGKEWEEYMDEMWERIRESGNVSDEEVKAFQRTVEDTVGTLRMNTMSGTPAWTWTRNLMSANSARLGGGFGGNQFIELAANIAMNGMSSLVNGRFKATWQGAGSMLYRGRAPEDEFTQAMVASGFLESALHTSRINRQTDAEMGLNPGMLEKNLHGVQDMVMKANGMRYFTAVMEDYAGGSIMTQIIDMSKKTQLGNAEIARLARWGLSPEQAKSLGADFGKHYDPKAGKFDLDQFTPENQSLFQMAIQNGVSEMVVQGDSIHTPNWMKTPGPMLKLMTQFMRFPLIAQETLLRKGMQEDQARFVGGIIASTATYMALKYTREQASIAAGFTQEIDAKYDYFGFDSEDARRRGVLGSFNYNANLGFMSSLWNYGALLTGNPDLGKDYQYDKGVSAAFGPTVSWANDFIKLTTSAYNGEFGTDKDQMILKGGAPFLSLPIISEGFTSMIKD